MLRGVTPKRWLLFSDLHARERSWDTCLDVLRAVWSTASRAEAGVVCLGDLFDEPYRSGAVQLELLNEALRVFSPDHWHLPTILLAGNHDQTDASGETTVLRAIAASNPAHVAAIEAPTVAHGALLLPWRAAGDADTLAALQAAASDDSVAAVAIHAAILGGRTNAAQLCTRDGIAPAAFPPGRPVYAGHFHRPHRIDGTNITYVGSPYQVSAAEAGEDKRMLLVRASDWSVEAELPIDAGARHFSARSLPALASFVAGDGGARAGDRIALHLSGTEAADAVAAAVAAARDAGFALTVRQASVSAFSAASLLSGDDSERALSPLAAFRQFADGQQVAAGVRARVESLLTEEAAVEADVPHSPRKLEMSDVTISGYGPFGKKRVRYALAQTGAVAVTGGNGVGKSTLLMSPLWALTGAGDARDSGPIAARAMLNDSCAAAEVHLTGVVDGRRWEIIRGITPRGGKLRFFLEDSDSGAFAELTGRTAESTQQRINGALFALPSAPRPARRLHELLSRTAFFAQQAPVTSLLSAREGDAKAALGTLVSLAVWDAAASQARRARSTAVARAERAADTARARAAAAEEAAASAAAKAEASAQWRAEQQRAVQALREAEEEGKAVDGEQEQAVDESALQMALAEAQHTMRHGVMPSQAVKDAQASLRVIAAAQADGVCRTCLQPIGEQARAAQAAAKAEAEAAVAAAEAEHAAEEARVTAAAERTAAQLSATLQAAARTRELTSRLLLARAKAEEVDPFAAVVDLLSSQLKTLQAEAAEAEASARQAVVEAEEWRDAERLLNKRTGFPNTLLVGVVEQLAMLTQRWMDAITDGDMTVQLRLQDNELQRAVHVGGALRSVSALSGGQRQRAEIAMWLGFADLVSYRTGLAMNVMVLDEAFRALDKDGRMRLAAVLTDSVPRSSLLVVSHDEDVKLAFPTTHTVFPDGSISGADKLVGRHRCAALDASLRDSSGDDEGDGDGYEETVE